MSTESLYDDAINTDNHYCHLINGEKWKRSSVVIGNLRMLTEHLLDKNEDINSLGNCKWRRQCSYKQSTNWHIIYELRFFSTPSEILEHYRNKGYFEKFPYCLKS